ncbi:MAG: isopentenyl phosphate kinase family protein [Candidatus Chisholmbacteria bacterium]|nr:isopentenyl phosphate kinase family protein [Candidatus Chisholmbacteria bacterium]
MAKRIVLVKLGGSLITDKTKPFTVRKAVLERVLKEVAEIFKEHKGGLVLGHGAGSFGHVVAEKYEAVLGNKGKGGTQGAAEVRLAAAELNRIVVEKLVSFGVPAVALSPSSCVVAREGRIISFGLDPVREMLERGFLPVTYGDVVMDETRGWTIASTEKVLGALALGLKKNFKVELVVHCGVTGGVEDAERNVIERITVKNFGSYKHLMNGAAGVDVTGGMLHKVEESLALVKEGVESLIVDGRMKGNIAKAIAGNGFVGTRIER